VVDEKAVGAVEAPAGGGGVPEWGDEVEEQGGGEEDDSAGGHADAVTVVASRRRRRARRLSPGRGGGCEAPWLRGRSMARGRKLIVWFFWMRRSQLSWCRQWTDTTAFYRKQEPGPAFRSSQQPVGGAHDRAQTLT